MAPRVNGAFKQDFVVQPGADASLVRVHYVGADGMHSDLADGHLLVHGHLGSFDEGGLIGLNAGNCVPMSYEPLGDDTYGFNILGSYDPSQPFTIDPNVIVWATFYGGTAADLLNDIHSDGTYVWACGSTLSTNFPCLWGAGAWYQGVKQAALDACILKFTVAGVRVNATYYGGNGDDVATSIRSDGTNVLVVGGTRSSNFSTLNPGGGAYFQNTMSAGSDMFLLKFNVAGVRQWATYYGGDGLDSATAVSYLRNAGLRLRYVRLLQFPLSKSGWWRLFRGHQWGHRECSDHEVHHSRCTQLEHLFCRGRTDIAQDLSISGTSIFVVGYGNSSNWPVQSAGGGCYVQAWADGPEAFIAKFTTAGVKQWSTYYGGLDDEQFNAVHCDGTSVWVTGSAISGDFPLMNPGGGAYFQPGQNGDESE